MGKRKKTWFQIAICWLPVLIWMAVIFHFSSQSFSQQNLNPWIQKKVSDHSVREHLSGIDFKYGGSEISIAKQGVPGFVQFFIRKSAHMIEFGVLGMLFTWMLWRVSKMNLLYVAALSLLSCIIYASIDEFHQMFSKGRTPSVTDVLLDSICALLGILLVLWFAAKKRI
ncbi:MAG TPA: VanZ family protein [Bacilli bacterium]